MQNRSGSSLRLYLSLAHKQQETRFSTENEKQTRRSSSKKARQLSFRIARARARKTFSDIIFIEFYAVEGVKYLLFGRRFIV